jgi:hypothetical protein
MRHPPGGELYRLHVRATGPGDRQYIPARRSFTVPTASPSRRAIVLVAQPWDSDETPRSAAPLRGPFHRSHIWDIVAPVAEGTARQIEEMPDERYSNRLARPT